MMKRFYGLSTEFFFFSLSADNGSAFWSSYNIFSKILRYTSSENTVVHDLDTGLTLKLK